MNTELSQSALGRALGLSKSRVSTLKKLGMPVVSIEAARAWRAAHQSIARRKVVPPSSAHPGLGSAHEAEPSGEGRNAFDFARTRREVAEANLAEIREAELRGELIRVSAVETVLARALAGMREHLLQVRCRLAPLLAAETDAFLIDQMLDAEMNQALSHMAGVDLHEPRPKLSA